MEDGRAHDRRDRVLHDRGLDEELVAAGLLHDSVERGTLSEARLRSEMDASTASLVMALTEDSSIGSFGERKGALREQVERSGPSAVTVFAADKLSDIRGLRRGIGRFGEAIEARMGTTVDEMAGHYRGSVEMIAAAQPESAFVPALYAELETLAQTSPVH
jgi:HD domain